MVERRIGLEEFAHESPPKQLHIQHFPYRLAVASAVDKILGHDLTPQGHRLLRELVGEMLKDRRVLASRDVSKIYENARTKINIRGKENIPSAGSTIVIGNHTLSGPLRGMAQFFEVSRVVYEGRTDVDNEEIREPYVIMQRGITRGNRIARYYIGEFYELAGRSLRWELVMPPAFDINGQIVNSQGLSGSAISRLEEGGAMIWYPQGTHRDANNLNFPDKASAFLKKVADRNIQIVPLRVLPESQDRVDLIFGEPVHISDLQSLGNGKADINEFAKKHIAPLG